VRTYMPISTTERTRAAIRRCWVVWTCLGRLRRMSIKEKSQRAVESDLLMREKSRTVSIVIDARVEMKRNLVRV